MMRCIQPIFQVTLDNLQSAFRKSTALISGFNQKINEVAKCIWSNFVHIFSTPCRKFTAAKKAEEEELTKRMEEILQQLIPTNAADFSESEEPPLSTVEPPQAPATEVVPRLEGIHQVYFFPSTALLDQLLELEAPDKEAFKKAFVKEAINQLKESASSLPSDVKNRALLKINEAIGRYVEPSTEPSKISSIPGLTADNCWGYFIFTLGQIGELAKMDEAAYANEVGRFKAIFMKQIGDDLSLQEKERLFPSSFKQIDDLVLSRRAYLTSKKEMEKQSNIELLLLPKEPFSDLTNKSSKTAKTKAKDEFKRICKGIPLQPGQTLDQLYSEYRNSQKRIGNFYFIEVPQTMIDALTANKKKIKAESDIIQIFGPDFLKREAKSCQIPEELLVKKLITAAPQLIALHI